MLVASHRGDFQCPTHGEGVKLSPLLVLERKPLKTFPSTGAHPQPVGKLFLNPIQSPTRPNSASRAVKEAAGKTNITKIIENKKSTNKITKTHDDATHFGIQIYW